MAERVRDLGKSRMPEPIPEPVSIMWNRYLTSSLSAIRVPRFSEGAEPKLHTGPRARVMSRLDRANDTMRRPAACQRAAIFSTGRVCIRVPPPRRKDSDGALVQRDRRCREIRFSFRMADDAEISKPVCRMAAIYCVKVTD